MLPLPDAKPLNSLGIGADQHAPQPPQDPARWQRDLAQAVRDIPGLLQQLNLASTDTDAPRLAEDSRFPLLVPPSYLQRMRPGNWQDPLLLQVLPLQQEQQTVAGFVPDAVGDQQARKAPGLLQKYAGRALLILAGSCAVHCRYCFRRDYPYGNEPRTLADWEPTFRELEQDTSIEEVILSGGDPLMLPDKRLAQLAERLASISHLTRLRVHTRLPIVLPSRVTDSLLQILTESRLQSVVVVHANHAQEIRQDCRDQLQRIVHSGLPVLNQAVLLRGINDSLAAQEELCRSLINIGVMPYYLHQLDRVQGAAHFEVNQKAGLQLIEQLRGRLPGYAVPRYVREVEGETSKTPLLA